jgi:CubicO group peptidase (beta-lactamase class C family)
MKFIVLLIAAAFSTILSAQQPAFIADSIDLYANREMKAWDVPGMAVTIVKDGKVVMSKGYGVRKAGTKDPVNEETLFQIASNSKAFTATALAILEVEKKLSLDDTVRRWIPGFRMSDPYVSSRITIRDLLCNRVGLSTFQGDMLHWNTKLSREELINHQWLHQPQFGFRAKYGYYNMGFVIAGDIIKHVCGLTWEQFVEQRFLKPLQMTRTSVSVKGIRDDKNAAAPHSRWEGKQVIVPYDDIDNIGPAASINSCVKDLAKWLQCQLDSGKFNGQEVIPFPALQETRKPHTIMPNPSALFPGMHFQAYGLGWQMADFYGKKIYYHGGAADGFLTHTCFIPELNLGFAILTNTDYNSLYVALRYQILDAYLGNPYRNYSSIFLKNTLATRDKEDRDGAAWKEAAAKKPAWPVNPEQIAGPWANPVYGNMNITFDKAGNVTAKFQNHDMINATMQYIGNNEVLMNYNTPMWGITKGKLILKEGRVVGIEIGISDFVDPMPYLFQRTGSAAGR